MINVVKYSILELSHEHKIRWLKFGQPELKILDIVLYMNGYWV